MILLKLIKLKMMVKIEFQHKKYSDEQFKYNFKSPSDALIFIAQNPEFEHNILEGEDLMEAFIEYEEIELGGEG